MFVVGIEVVLFVSNFRSSRVKSADASTEMVGTNKGSDTGNVCNEIYCVNCIMCLLHGIHDEFVFDSSVK